MSRKATIIILVSWILITGFGSSRFGRDREPFRQPLVGGLTVDEQTRRELGLLRLLLPGALAVLHYSTITGQSRPAIVSMTLRLLNW